MAKTDDAHRGYRARFKSGKVVRETITESLCLECGDGTKGLYTRTWVESDVPDRTLYHIEGTCTKGHDVDRYGYGEAVA
jgi:predicted phage-related endonuclease